MHLGIHQHLPAGDRAVITRETPCPRLPRPESSRPRCWLNFGTPNAAYVRPAVQDGQPVYAIYSADGTQLAAAPSRALAFTLIRQNDLEPYDAH